MKSRAAVARDELYEVFLQLYLFAGFPAALEAVKAFVTSCGWTVRNTADSPIEGGDGNRESLLWAQRP